LELEKVDHAMGKKRTELQFLTDSLERKQGEINQLIRDTESELSSNKREIKVYNYDVFIFQANHVLINCVGL
jgi:hypothetical protein